MTEFKFQWQKFKMEESAKDFLEKYISRIDKYAKSHNISDDLVDDIHQSILEKLFEMNGEINQKKLISIVNSIWEPEDIFEEDIDSFERNEPKLDKKSDLKPYEKRQKTNWTRPRDKSILLWVCAMFGQATAIPTWIRRILAILWSWFFLAANMEEWFFFWRWVYVILALIFPIKDKDYKHCSMLVYRWTQVRDLRLFIPNFFTRFFWICKRVVKTAIPSIIRFLSKLFWPLWTLIKYIFLICRSLFLIWIVIFLWVFLYYLITWFVLRNIDYTSLFPVITKWWVIFGIISAFLFLLASVWCIFKKKLSNNIGLIIALWCGILAIIIAIISIWEIKNLYWPYEQKVTKEIEIEIPNKENTLNIFNSNFHDKLFWGILFSNPQFANIHLSDNDKLKVVYTFNFRNSNPKYVSQAMENISDLDYKFEFDTLYIWQKDNLLFNKVTPAIPLYISIDYYIPMDIEIELLNVSTYANNLQLPVRAWTPWIWAYAYSCNKIKYNETTSNFYCSMDIDYRHRDSILEANLIWMADVIVPLKWTNSVWSEVRQWKFSHEYDPYWRFDSMNFYKDTRKDNRVQVKYSDKFFNFFIDVEYNIDPNTAEFTYVNSILRDVEQKWLMDSERMKHYEWREKLSDYEIQMRENEEEKVKKEQEIQNLQDRIKVLEEKLDELTLDSSEN